MSRSTRVPAHPIASGADPAAGKKKTSRRIRRAVHQEIHVDQEEFDFVDPLDVTRGNSGTRDPDYGWDYFGDGKTVAKSDKYVEKYSRK